MPMTHPSGSLLHADSQPDLTEAQRKHLDALARLPDDRIDYGDIPPLTDAQLLEFRRAVPTPVRKRPT